MKTATVAPTLSFEEGVRSMTEANFSAVMETYRARRDVLIARATQDDAAFYQRYIDAFVIARNSHE
jgi:hypothetical protein